MKMPELSLKFLAHHKKQKTVSPLRDWMRMLEISALVAFVLVALSLYLFYRINQGGLFAGETVEGSAFQPLNEKSVIDVVKFYEARKAKLAAFELDPAFNSDPSVR